MSKIVEILSSVIHPVNEVDIVSGEIAQDLVLLDAQGEQLDVMEPDVEAKVDTIKFKLVFPSPDPLSGSIKRECEQVLLKAFPSVKVQIMELVRERKQTKKTVNESIHSLTVF